MRIQRTRKIASTVTMAMAGVLLHSSVLAADGGKSSVTIERIETRKDGPGREVVIHTSKEATYSVFRLSDPFRILVDVSDATMAEPMDLLKVDDGVLRYISTSHFADELSAITRIEVAVAENAPYEVNASRDGIVVRIGKAQATKPSPTKASKQLRLGKLSAKTQKGVTRLSMPILEGEVEADGIHIEQIDDPTRLVVDVVGAQPEPKWQRANVERQGVVRARVGATDDGTRIVLDIARGQALPKLDVVTEGKRLALLLSTPKPEAPAPVAKATATVEAKPELARAETKAAMASEPEISTTVEPEAAAVSKAEIALVPEIAPSPARETPAAPVETKPAPALVADEASRIDVKDVRFEPKDGFVRLTMVLGGEADAVRDGASKSGAPVLRIPNARLPDSLERTLDVTAVAGEVVRAISTFTQGTDTVITADIGAGTEHRHWRKGNRIMWDFRAQVAAAQPTTESIEFPEQVTSGYASPALQAATLLPSKRYTGRRISLDLKDADIHNILRLLADVSKLNIVAADDVTGKVTIKLRNVPWDQALDIILRSKQLDKTRSGNIIRVAPIETLRKEEELRLERQKAQMELEPLSVRLIPVSYAVATEIKPQVTALLSPRGKVNIDKRTNVLVVEDIGEVLMKVERLVRTLDTQTPQVLIEARIVEARSNFDRSLGIQWGGQVSMSQQYGTSTGLGFPNNIRIAGASDDQQGNVTEGVLSNPNYAINLPAPIGSGTGGGLGFIFGSAGGSAILNLRLSAAESAGKIKIISSPKIVTMDNKEAKILSGEKVPITVITANGPTTRFIDANIELLVTPHVTQDGSVLMKVDAKKNELSDRRDIFGTPGIITKEASTEMIVRDGDTAVLGGLYRRTARDSKAYVPWIGQVPVLGWLFKTSQLSDARDELLIFISPRIVNRAQALVATE